LQTGYFGKLGFRQIDYPVESYIPDQLILLSSFNGKRIVQRGEGASGWVISTLKAEVVWSNVVIRGTLCYAIVIIPESALTFSAVAGDSVTLTTNWIAFLAGDEIIKQESSSWTAAHTALAQVEGLIHTALFGASPVFRNVDVTRKTTATICGYASTASSWAGQTLGGTIDGITVESSGASLLTFSSSLEGEVGICTIGLASIGRVILVVVYRESWAIR
jgi:hypothetical protein